MANKFYDHLNYPQSGAPGSSVAMRAELDAIETGFDIVESDIAIALTGATGAVTAATTKAAEALASANNAEVSEANALASKNAAAISETNAAASEAAALAVKNSVDATYDQFDDRYLGTKASAPTLDNDGNDLQTGTLYWDSTLNTLRGYNGVAWVNLPATTASNVTSSSSGNLAATNVQAALVELQLDIDTREKSINAASAKVTPVDADTVGLIDSAAANVLKKVTWANIKATLKSYFDTIYATSSSLIASSVSFTATGSISASDVQAAIAELDSEKLSTAAGSVSNNNLSDGYINDLTAVTFDPLSDYVPIADGSDAGNKKKALLPTISDSALFDFTATVASNELTITLAPISVDFRSTTLNSGVTTTITKATTTVLTVPSGATLGTLSGIQSRLAVIALNNAGTIEVAVVNANGTLILNEQSLISTTILNTSSDSANVAYSTTARSNVAYRVVGYVEYTQATSGIYATEPSLVQPLGGMAELSRINSSSEVTATGTSVDITGIPSWTKKISVLFNGVSTNGTSNILVQLGNGTVISSGYNSTATTQSGATNVNSTTGMLVTAANGASDIHSGIMQLMKVGQTGMISSSLVKAGASLLRSAAGDLSYTGTIDRIRFTTVNGTDAFDGGTFTIIFE